MPPRIVSRRMLGLLGLCVMSYVLVGTNAGCLKIGGNEPLLKVESPNAAPAPVDTSRVPSVTTTEEGRQRLTEAYQRIDYLEQQLSNSRDDNARLKADLKNVKRERDAYKDRLKHQQND